MAKREDEYWAGRKEASVGGRRRQLCPFCGKEDRVYYNKLYKSWRCGYCEASFPSPSGGTFTGSKGVSEVVKVADTHSPSKILPIVTNLECPFCGGRQRLFYSNAFVSWKCKSCRRFFTYKAGKVKVLLGG